MLNVDKKELSPWTWKNNISITVVIGLVTTLNIALWVGDFGDSDILTKLVVTILTILYIWWISDTLIGNKPSNKKFSTPEKRQKLIERDIVNGLKYTFKFNPKIEESEEGLREDIKTVLLKLSNEY